MYFKTKQNSETGLKLAEIKKKANLAFKETKELAKEIGFSKWREGYWQAFGGISCVIFDSTPDSKIWKKQEDGYMPKLNTKKGKAIQEKIDKITSVDYFELNECVGFNGGPFKHIGTSFNNDEFFAFSVGENWNFKAPKDCVEITVSEFKELFVS